MFSQEPKSAIYTPKNYRLDLIYRAATKRGPFWDFGVPILLLRGPICLFVLPLKNFLTGEVLFFFNYIWIKFIKVLRQISRFLKPNLDILSIFANLNMPLKTAIFGNSKVNTLVKFLNFDPIIFEVFHGVINIMNILLPIFDFLHVLEVFL